MARYETDEEKVEALKRWWKENSTAVILGVVVGVGAIVGWRVWDGYQENRAQSASAVFEQLLMTVDAGIDPAATMAQAERLATDYRSTPYAAFGFLVTARVALEQGEIDEAQAALEQAIDAARDPALARIAAVRLARLLVSEQDYDGALTLIEQHDDQGSFSGEFAVLRGDIAVARGDIEQARTAYRLALAVGVSQTQLIEIKLADLPEPG